MCAHPPDRLFAWVLDWPVYAGRLTQEKTCVCCSQCGAVLMTPSEPTKAETRRASNVFKAQKRIRQRKYARLEQERNQQ